VFWVQGGSGTFCAETGEYPFAAHSLLFLVPYQSFRFLSDASVRGLCLQFHANFLCIETYHAEIGCNGVLFNDSYGVPCVGLEDGQTREVALLLDEIRRELQERGLAHSEALLSYLKIFLVRAARLKLQQQELACGPQGRLPEVLTNLQRLIEEHFRTYHAPADYAAMLHISSKSLARVVKTHLKTTLTELIRERILRQSKWELLHTRKPVKEVAAGLGFQDVFYFSRLFTRSTGCSPTFFREFETAIRGGRNLSM
jgi:AraC-like DNA-binding protein